MPITGIVFDPLEYDFYAEAAEKLKNEAVEKATIHAREEAEREILRKLLRQRFGPLSARENATLEQTGKDAGFTAEARDMDIAAELERWQAAHDPLLWKLIISPEFGDRADLLQLTRDLMERISSDLKTDLEWVAVAHHNTEHPHVHIALRGVTADGKALKLERQYIKAGVRNLAEELCTQQLGYRTALDAAEAERREIFDHRFTSLDRIIIRRSEVPGEEVSGEWMLQTNVGGAGQRDVIQVREQHIIKPPRVLGDHRIGD